MAENEFDTREVNNCSQNGGFNETVCIDAQRVYDSCGDKDCLEDLEVYFTPPTQNIIDKATNVRLRDVEVITVLLDLEPVPFHKGFYSVDMTFFFDVCLDVFMQPAAVPVTVSGLSVFSKKVILYGSEGNVKVFSSDFKLDEFDHQNMFVLVTIGIFTIVQIERNVQMMIPAYDFCIPDKECVTSCDNPCELFSRIDFPTDEFFPPKSTELDEDCGCSLKHKNHK